MSWAEAARLTTVLMSDPTSRVHAAAAGWQHPVSREWLALAELHKLVAEANFKNAADLRLRMPWEKPTRKHHGGPGVTTDRLMRLLAAQRALPARVQEPTTVDARKE